MPSNKDWEELEKWDREREKSAEEKYGLDFYKQKVEVLTPKQKERNKRRQQRFERFKNAVLVISIILLLGLYVYTLVSARMRIGESNGQMSNTRDRVIYFLTDVEAMQK